MDETMNNDTSGWWELGRHFLSTDSTSSIDGKIYNWVSDTYPEFLTTSTALDVNAFTLTSNTSWNLNDYSQWPKGVSDASFEKKYTPKWHILQGYKNQMESMWD